MVRVGKLFLTWGTLKIIIMITLILYDLLENILGRFHSDNIFRSRKKKKKKKELSEL